MRQRRLALLLVTAMVLVCVSALQAADTEEQNNDFYDNEPMHELTVPALRVDGEVVKPGAVDLSSLPMRSVIVKEALLAEDGGAKFVGAYRYDGYSLFDILRTTRVAKLNKEEFPRCIDQYVVIQNDKGDKVVASWGEVFYPSAVHRIIVATRVSLIVPSVTKERWPVPTQARLVFADDLVSVRNIEQPSVITVRSCPRKFKVDRKIDPLHSPVIGLFRGDARVSRIEKLEQKLPQRRYPTVFYGRGKGIHGITLFAGSPLKDILSEPFPSDLATLQRGLITVAAVDGYRVVCSYSEILNRADQVDFLLVDEGERRGGRFKVFPAADFFSDRAIKAVAAMHLDLVD